MEPLVRLAGVTYRYHTGQPALDDLDLAIEPGAFVLLAGASGSGKSTVCRLLNGLIPHLQGGELSGVVWVAGHDVRLTPPAVLSREVGLLLQNPEAQCFGATVAHDIAFGPACQGLDRATIAARVQEAAALLNVTHLLDRAPHTLSGGEQQRVALAGVLALRPKLLALDEPFAALDARSADDLSRILRELHRQGVTIVVAEHRLEEVAAVATRMIILEAGRVVADGPPRPLVARGLEAWGLEPPPAARLAHAAGLPATPLTVDEAAQALKGRMVAWPPDRNPMCEARPAVEWNAVCFERGGRKTLREVDLRSDEGSITALLGANGAGKTTLLRLANGLLRPQAGILRVMGRPVGRRPVADLAREVGLVAQQPEHMFFKPAVCAEIEAGPRALRRHNPAWISEVVERLKLGALLDRVPQRLSAGEQRRVALAAALATRPRALLLDEPTAGQDAAGRRTLSALLDDCANTGMAIVCATHDTEWAVAGSTYWAVLDDGRIAAHDTPGELCKEIDLLERAALRPPAAALLRRMIERREAHHVLNR
jgi:energy-coupling factor transporter ATP-binding protein EcfA2